MKGRNKSNAPRRRRNPQGLGEFLKHAAMGAAIPIAINQLPYRGPDGQTLTAWGRFALNADAQGRPLAPGQPPPLYLRAAPLAFLAAGYYVGGIAGALGAGAGIVFAAISEFGGHA